MLLQHFWEAPYKPERLTDSIALSQNFDHATRFTLGVYSVGTSSVTINNLSLKNTKLTQRIVVIVYKVFQWN